MPQESKTLKFAIIIPAFNEEQYINLCLDSLLNQTQKPSKIIVVDDNSTDKTLQIVQDYALNNPIVEVISSSSRQHHQPGAKVIKAFNRGLRAITLKDYDLICKFDADLEFPTDYLSTVNDIFNKHSEIGLCGGVCSILRNDKWKIESLTNLDHVRGALKAYRVNAFQEIEGLPEQMGWDTADEFKLRFKNWKVKVVKSLMVKHHKETGKVYSEGYFEKQGQVFFALRYGFLLCLIASIKISLNKGKFFKALKILKSYYGAKRKHINYLLTEEEGKFLRSYRYDKIKEKLLK